MRARPRPTVEFTSFDLVPPAQRTRRVARILGLCIIAFLITALVSPWQQSVSGTGRVIAYAPNERRQRLDAPVSGRIVRWWVGEGVAVKQGDPIVEILDNDPMLVERLASEREAVLTKLESYTERALTLERSIGAVASAQRSEIKAAEAKLRVTMEKLRSAEQKLEALEAGAETAALNLGRVSALAERGLSAKRDLELAQLAGTKAHTERVGAQADVMAAIADVDAAGAALEKARAEGDSKVQEAEAKQRSSRSDEADARGSLAKLEVTIARQAGQLIRAPRDGVILQVLAAQGGEQVKQGDTLAVLVPDTRDRAVELWVDGNDASIVSERRHVRLQFEGWPAVQFTGWPSAAVGTFGGVVSFVDPHDDGKGNFRVVIVPDVNDRPWPQPRFLRQGVRTKGWVLLEQVKLGFELWRRFNGFPPMLDEEPRTGEPAKKEKK